MKRDAGKEAGLRHREAENLYLLGAQPRPLRRASAQEVAVDRNESFWAPEEGVDGDQRGNRSRPLPRTHLTPAELERMKLLGVDARHVAGPPNGFIVGDAAPPELGDIVWRDHCPAVPVPRPGSTGDRLDAVRGHERRGVPRDADAPQPLRSLPDSVARGSRDAVRWSREAGFEIAAIGGTWRVLLLGDRVAQAFGIGGFFGKPTTETIAEECSIEMLAIPFPSGLSHGFYNDPKMQKLAGLAVPVGRGTRMNNQPESEGQHDQELQRREGVLGDDGQAIATCSATA